MLFSFSSIEKLSKIMPVAFHDSKITITIQLSEAKARYLTKFGLALYFKEKIFFELSTCRRTFNVIFWWVQYKTNKCLYRILVRKIRQGVTYYCDFFFFFSGHANADIIAKKILSFISENNLKLEHLFQCSMDGS